MLLPPLSRRPWKVGAGVFGFGFGCEPEGIAEVVCVVEGMELASAFAAGLVVERDDVQVLLRAVDAASPGAFEFETERVECAGRAGLGLVQLKRCRLNSLSRASVASSSGAAGAQSMARYSRRGALAADRVAVRRQRVSARVFSLRLSRV